MAESLQISPRTESHQPHFDILLMGISGQGKSATGNSIIGRKQFESKGGFYSVTKDYHVGHTNLWGYNIKIVDIPGFADTDEGSDDQKRNLVIKALTTALCKFPNGFHVVLLVISYTHRWTKEMKKNVCDMFKTFDEEAFRTHGILVVTSGDAFKRDHKDDDMTLKSWLKTDFPEILEICDGRCLLYDNVTKNTHEKDNQNMHLLAKIKSIGNKRPYIPRACRRQSGDQKSFAEDQLRASKREEISNVLGLMKDNVCKNGLDKEKATLDIADIKRRVESLESTESNQSLYETIDKLTDLVKRNEEAPERKRETEETITRAQKELDKNTSNGSWWDTVWSGVTYATTAAAMWCTGVHPVEIAANLWYRFLKS